MTNNKLMLQMYTTMPKIKYKHNIKIYLTILLFKIVVIFLNKLIILFRKYHLIWTEVSVKKCKLYKISI